MQPPGFARADLCQQFFDEYYNSPAAGGRVLQLGDGMVAVPTYSIVRDPKMQFSAAQRAQASKMASAWKVPGATDVYGGDFWAPARTPDVAVDNLVFRWEPGMKEPELVVGRWKKKVQMFGEDVAVDGLALAGGGHCERPCDRSKHSPPGAKYEAGSMSTRLAADQELKEEIGIDKKKLRASRYFGTEENFLRDGRKALITHIYLRWIEDKPSSSDELRSVYGIPLSRLETLCSRELPFTAADGTELYLELGHDKLIAQVMHTQSAADFTTRIVTFYDRARSGGISSY